MKMVKWERKPLGIVADLCLGKMLDQNKNRGEPLPYLANLNVRWGEFALDNLRTMRFEHRELDRYGLKFGDIVMCEGGEPGRCAIWKDQVPGMMIQKALHRIRPKQYLDYRFLFYSFLRIDQLKGFGQFFTGATIKHLPGEKLSKVEIEFPPLPTQRKIAAILSAYDDLIENNQQRIKILEEMAQNLYREWFVKFRFPGYKKAKFVNSTMGKIPEGWEVKKLGELTAYLNRGLSPSYSENGDSSVINQKCIRDQRVNLEPSRRQLKPIPPDKSVRFGDVLINSTGVGTLGRIAQVYEKLDGCTVDTHVTIVRASNKIDLDFLGCALLTQQETFERLGVGATGQTELSRTSIADVEIVTPPGANQQKFGVTTRPIRTAAMILDKKNQNLRRTRDLLLPKLISGELDVSSLDITIPSGVSS
jgi:type I restriction enzyme S subunit